MSRPTEQKMWLICQDGNVRPVDATLHERGVWRIEEPGEFELQEEGSLLFENPIVAFEKAIERQHRHLRHIAETTTKQVEKLVKGMLHAQFLELRERYQLDAKLRATCVDSVCGTTFLWSVAFYQNTVCRCPRCGGPAYYQKGGRTAVDESIAGKWETRYQDEGHHD